MVGEVLVDVESVAAQLYRALLLYQSLGPSEQAAAQRAVRDLLFRPISLRSMRQSKRHVPESRVAVLP